MKPTLLAMTLLTSALSLPAFAQGAPKIQFEQTVYDFGKTSGVATVTGVFKFKNTGDAPLKVEPPKPSCGCTVTEVKPDTLAPGTSGELRFTLHLGQVKAQFDKRIGVTSNDPHTPEISLTVKADYTPLYEVNPLTLAPQLAFQVNDTTEFTTVTRTDGQPLGPLKLVTSKPWITAKVEPGGPTNATTARIRVAVQREGAPRRFSEFIQLYAAGQTNTPVASIYVFGQLQGEITLTPEALYWSITDAANASAARPEAQVVQRVKIRSAAGQTLALKNAHSTIPGLQVQLVPQEAGQGYELVARLDQVPATTLSGKVTFDTTLPAQPHIELPVIVNVAK